MSGQPTPRPRHAPGNLAGTAITCLLLGVALGAGGVTVLGSGQEAAEAPPSCAGALHLAGRPFIQSAVETLEAAVDKEAGHHVRSAF